MQISYLLNLRPYHHVQSFSLVNLDKKQYFCLRYTFLFVRYSNKRMSTQDIWMKKFLIQLLQCRLTYQLCNNNAGIPKQYWIIIFEYSCMVKHGTTIKLIDTFPNHQRWNLILTVKSFVWKPLCSYLVFPRP